MTSSKSALQIVFSMREPSFLIAAFAFISAPALADQSESVFRDALAYTVQIRTTVRVPFGDDDKGSSRGAGFVVDAARGWVMTNAHVVSRLPSRVEISYKDRPCADAKKVYVDPLLDVAIVEIKREEGAPLAAAKLECEAVPPVGHPHQFRGRDEARLRHPHAAATGHRPLAARTEVRLPADANEEPTFKGGEEL